MQDILSGVRRRCCARVRGWHRRELRALFRGRKPIQESAQSADYTPRELLERSHATHGGGIDISGNTSAPPFPAHAPPPRVRHGGTMGRAGATWSSMSGRRAGRYLNQLFMIPGGFGGSRLQRTAAARPRCGAPPADAEHESTRGTVHEGKYRWACDFILVLGASGKALPA